MTSPIRAEADLEDDAALGVEAEAVGPTEDPYYLHQAVLNAAARPTHLEVPKKKWNALLATGTKYGRCKAIFLTRQRTWEMLR